MYVDTPTLVILLVAIATLLGGLVALDRRWPPDAPVVPPHAAASQRSQLVEVFVIAAWFGLLTAALHLLLVFINRYGRGLFVMVSPQIVWLAPVAYVVTVGGVAVIPAAMVLFRAPGRARRAAILAGASLCVFALLLPFWHLHRLATALLSVGVAIQVCRVMNHHPARWSRIMRKTGLAAGGAIIAMSVTLWGWRAAADALAIRNLPTAAAGAPNVLLIVLDTVRARNLSLHGYERPTTPGLERWARGGTTFDMAFSTGPWTLKSHATMFTGLYPSQIGGDFERPVRTRAPMLAEMFRDRGYMTGGFAANLLYTTRESGLVRGFVHYDDYRFSYRQLLLHSWLAHIPLVRGILGSRSMDDLVDTVRNPAIGVEFHTFPTHTYRRRSAGEISTAFLKWHTETSGRPFLAFLNYFDAHDLYQAPPAFLARFAMPAQPRMGEYDAAIAYIDHEIDRLLGELERRGALSNTIVVVTADHGEQFGEHGLNDHGNSLYLPLLRVPLLVRYPPRVPANLRVETPVTLRDLAATIVDLAGLASIARVPGTSLFAAGGPAGPRNGSTLVAEVERHVRPPARSPIRFGAMQAVFDEEFHYIRRGDGHEELFAYRLDPGEIKDLSSTPEGKRAIERFRRALNSSAEF